MNTHVLKTSDQAVLHEQLALKRLKKILILQLARLLWLAQRAELVREVAPGKPPLARHEWERLEHRPML
jgi:hypothetical protein